MREVEVEAVWEEEDSEAELDPGTLGVPGLKTLVPGDRVEVLWAHGAPSPPSLGLVLHPRRVSCTALHPARMRRLGEGANQGVRARDAIRRTRYHLPHHVR